MKSATAPLLAPTSKSHRWLAALIVAACAPTLLAWTPGTGTPNATSGFVVDPANRLDDLSFYNCTYPASENYAANIAWTGSVASDIAGTTSVAFKDDVLRRINFYRALSALPADISLDATKSGKDQEAALMMSANNARSTLRQALGPPTPPTGRKRREIQSSPSARLGGRLHAR